MVYNNFLLQESCSPGMYLLSSFHDFSLSIILFILTFVGGLTHSVIFNSYISFNSVSVTTEVVWTVIPMFILGMLALPSLKILYFLEEGDPCLTYKVVGHQWYWTYDISEKVSFDSYMDVDSGSEEGGYRLLDVDHRLVMPFNWDVRALITSSDVLHCWTVPSLGVKADAVPGRLNQLMMTILRPSILYGQCSEICGANHSFMPIVVESIPLDNCLEWMTIN